MPFRALKDKTIGFNPNLALSTYTACSFGVWLQNLIHKVRHNKHGELRKNMGTVLTVFDSMLIEINPNHREQWKNYILSYIKPFRADIQYGKTFFDAAYKEKRTMKTIICVASHEELPENFHAGTNTEVFITGIGLVNAAIALSEKLNDHYGPCRVLNIGNLWSN